MNKLCRALPEAVVAKVVSMSPPIEDRGEDTWTWGGESNDQFSIRSAYDLISDADNLIPMVDWKAIWNWKGPQRIRQFLWLAMHKKLLTNQERRRRHLTDNAGCTRCGGGEESVLHVLRDCPFASEVWNGLNLSNIDANWWLLELNDWLLNLINNERNLLLGITCWHLWKARNEMIFEGADQPALSLVRKITNWSVVVSKAAGRLNQSRLLNKGKARVDIAWEPGPAGWLVLNTDGSVINPSGIAAAGGVIRDELGRCSLAFSSNVGSCYITRAELRGVAIGLKLAWEAEARKVVVQADSRAAISLIEAEGAPSHQHSGEVLSIRELLMRGWEVVFQHIYREGNRTTDFLTNLGHSLTFGIHLIPISDCNLGFYLRLDTMGISDSRSIFVTT
ncbi:Putative ribonuclease H protein At1g65750 [Linum perenne]